MIAATLGTYFKASNLLWDILTILLIGLSSVFLTTIIIRLFEYYLNRFRAANRINYNIRELFSFWLNIFFGSIITLNFLSKIVFIDTMRSPFKHALFIAAVVSGLNILTRLITILKCLFRVYIDSRSPNTYRQRTLSTQFQFIEKVIALAIWSLGIATILWSFDSARTVGKSLLASAGLVGLAIGFAAQKSLSNLLAGFQIAFTQPMRLDDVVIVEGQWGRVEEITLTYVVICLWDLRRLIVPINYFIEKPFENWTKTSSDILGYVFIYVDYSLPVDELRTEFDRILKSTDLWDGKVKAMQVTDATEKTLVIRALMSASNAPTAFDLRCYVREKLIHFIQKHYPECLPRHRIGSEKATKMLSDEMKMAEYSLYSN